MHSAALLVDVFRFFANALNDKEGKLICVQSLVMSGGSSPQFPTLFGFLVSFGVSRLYLGEGQVVQDTDDS